jgi:hypothetical protein
VLPEAIDAWLDIEGIISPEYLILPKKIETLYAEGLSSTRGLILPIPAPRVVFNSNSIVDMIGPEDTLLTGQF